MQLHGYFYFIWIHGNRYVSKQPTKAPATGNYLSVFVWLVLLHLLYSAFKGRGLLQTLDGVRRKL